MDSNLYILKLGGSLISKNTEHFEKNYLNDLKKLLEKFIQKGKRFIIIVGGGKICRWYQEEALKLCNATNSDRNWIGAYVTRVNAEIVNSFFKPLSHDRAYYEFDKEITLEKSILIVGAWKPETSTNMDAVRMAEKFASSTLINLSNIDHVYDKDPKKFPDAKAYSKLTWPEYEKIIAYKLRESKEHQAGDNLPFDIFATEKAKTMNLQVIFTDGTNLNNLAKILEQKNFDGTTIG